MQGGKIGRLVIGLASALALAGCGVPSTMHLIKGNNPGKVDDTVRFQTTYYFRTFDYCWDAKAQVKYEGDTEAIPYRKIIPQTDTLYRYRMTGKADALFMKIRFESGTMTAAEIAPFGKSAKIDPEIGDPKIAAPKTGEAENAPAKSAAANAEQLEKIHIIAQYYNSLTDAEKAGAGVSIAAGLKEAIAAYLAMPKVTDADLIALNTEISGFSDKLTAAKGEIADKIAAAQKAIIDKLPPPGKAADAAPAEPGVLTGFCRFPEKPTKGFQIMGPEGIRTFKQDERLVMAMTTSSAPLIATMQEYSNRVLSSKGSNAAQSGEITTEMLHATSALRVLSDARRAEAEPDAIYNQIIAAFDPPATTVPKIPTAPRVP